MRIIPSLVEQTPDELFAVIAKLSPYFNRFQIDIEDGVYVKNKTLSLEDFAGFIRQNQKSVNRNVFYDFHLMVVNYEKDIETIAGLRDEIRIDTVLIHTSLHPDLPKIQAAHPYFQIGLVMNPEEDVRTIVKEYDFISVPIIQLMTIHPGPQGQSFIKESLNKIDQLRNESYKNEIYLDGAVNAETLPIILARVSKPNAVCPGSYLARAENLEERVALLREQTA